MKAIFLIGAAPPAPRLCVVMDHHQFSSAQKFRESRHLQGSSPMSRHPGWNQTVDKSNPLLVYFWPTEGCVKGDNEHP